MDLAGKVRAVLRAIRPHQWLKNLLLAVPAVASHQLDMGTIATLSIAFVSISLCASGGYVLNDLLDLSADRRHPRKRTRPFAAGQLSLATGIAMIATLSAPTALRTASRSDRRRSRDTFSGGTAAERPRPRGS